MKPFLSRSCSTFRRLLRLNNPLTTGWWANSPTAMPYRKKFARYWLAHNELALLLDGLDEVQAEQRANVVEKLKQYRARTPCALARGLLPQSGI